ncbi:MAG TPA: alpha/beta hydrolase family protein [Microthrixaceae bacterium]|nr:alpha/beta fold hydrolase [Microthrixaceae bacterium]HNI34336.1 alpha/beta hydrolase family protein [Microthrixaceae bacterium]
MVSTLRRGAPEPITIAGLSADRYRAGCDAGSGHDVPPLVVVHGAADRAAGFRRLARHLPDRDIVAYDRRGYAGSKSLPVATSLADHVADLLAVCRALIEEDGRRRLLVGHSIGGLIVLHALARTDVEQVALGGVVWEPPLAWNDWYRSRGDELVHMEPSAAAETFLRAMIGDRTWESLPAVMRDQRRSEGPALVSDMRNARTADAVVDFEAIGLPVISAHGHESGAHHRRSAAEVASRVTDARISGVEGANHGVHLADPAAFAELIESWPEGVAAPDYAGKAWEKAGE